MEVGENFWKSFGVMGLCWADGATAGRKARFWVFFGISLNVLMSKNFFLVGKFFGLGIFCEKFLGQLVIFEEFLEKGGELGNFLLYR